MIQPENYSKLAKNSRFAIAMTLCLGTAGLQAAQSPYTTPANSSNNNFTMLDQLGGLIGGAVDVEMTWDGTVFDASSDYTGPGTSTENMTLSSVTPFFGTLWTAHDVQVFIGPGTYTFDVTLGGGAAETGTLVMTLADGQLGAHMLFDWSVNLNIDVAVVWENNIPFPGDQTLSGSDPWNLASVDGDADGVAGIKMPAGGPFASSQANFNLNGIDFPNIPPTANDFGRSTVVDTPTVIDLTEYATDPDGTIDPASAAIVPGSGPTNGSLLNLGNGTVGYTPIPGFISPPTDSFQYTINDDFNETSNVATVTITVTAVANTPPVANDAAETTDEDIPMDIDVNSVASDADSGATLTFESFEATSAEGGAVTVDATNTILTYTPAADFNGTDTFGYFVTDGLDSSNTAIIMVTVNPVNDPLVCADVSLNTETDTPLAISVDNDLLSTCNDPEDDTITLASTTQPTQPGSTLSDDGAGTLTYTPAPDFSGQDSFTYTATDGTATDTRTVLVDVGKIFGNFTMLDGDGVTFGGTNDIVFTWDGTCYNSVAEADAGPVNMTMGSDSSFPFFGFPWFAHDIKVYCPGGPYTVDSCNAGVTPPDCGDLTFTVPADHLGGHILFDWNVTTDIDVAIVWNNSTGGTWQNVVPTGQLYQGPTGPTPALDEFYDWISVDADGDGIPGIQFVDGPFINFRANFNFKTTASGGGEVIVPESSISSPNLGSTNSVSCTISNTPVSLLERSDWLVLFGFITWFGVGGIGRWRQKLH